MLVYYFVPFIVSNSYLLFWASNGHNSVTVQNRTHVYMNFFDHKDLGNNLLQLCPKVVKHPVCYANHHLLLVGNFSQTLTPPLTISSTTFMFLSHREHTASLLNTNWLILFIWESYQPRKSAMLRHKGNSAFNVKIRDEYILPLCLQLLNITCFTSITYMRLSFHYF